MKISGLFHMNAQGFKLLWKNKFYAAASIATISACLFLFGVFFAALSNFQNIVHAAEENVSVTVFFKPGVTEEDINLLKVAIEERPEVADVTYISADEAWASFSEDYLGDYAEGFTENPLEDSANLEVNLNDVTKQSELVDYLEGLEEVRMVNRSELTATTLSGVNKLITYASVAIVVILLAVAVFLINNTIATGIEMRRDEITIMKYIGATDVYVRGPYVFEGLLLGIFGSILPLVLTYFLYEKALTFISTRLTVLSQLMEFLPIDVVFQKLVPITLVLGVGIGFFGSLWTIRKHLNV